MEITSTTTEQTFKAAEDFLVFLKSKKANATATIVGLSGDLGSGKTAFSKAVAKILGVGESVTSPTFVIEKIYQTTDPIFKQFIHIDTYRLESGAELNVLDFERISEDSENLIFIEWPERVVDILPEHMFTISFTFIDEDTRLISYDSK